MALSLPCASKKPLQTHRNITVPLTKKKRVGVGRVTRIGIVRCINERPKASTSAHRSLIVWEIDVQNPSWETSSEESFLFISRSKLFSSSSFLWFSTFTFFWSSSSNLFVASLWVLSSWSKVKWWSLLFWSFSFSSLFRSPLRSPSLCSSELLSFSSCWYMWLS